jgi:hypothetical protein
LAAFSSLLFPLMFQLQDEVSKWNAGQGEFFSVIVLNFLRRSKVNLFALVTILLIILLWHLFGERIRSKINPGILALAMVIVGYHFFLFAEKIDIYQAQAGQAQILFDLRETTDARDSAIMTDYVAFQVFYEYENLSVYERLPSHMIEEREARYYPANKATVEGLLLNQVEHIAISNENAPEIIGLLTEQQIEILETIENDSFQIIRIR